MARVPRPAEPDPSGAQLALQLRDVAEPPTMALPRLGFPLATDGGQPFDDDERLFEPWWPGAHAFLYRTGDHVEVRTEHLSDPLAVFPELREVALGSPADGLVVEGTLLALDAEGRPDARLLRRHLTGTTATGEVAEGAFVASDLCHLEGRSLARQPFVERRRLLASILPPSRCGVVDRGLVGEGVTLGRAVASLGLAAISARRLDGRWRPGPAGDDWLRLRVTEPPAVPTRPFLVLLERLPFGD
jgi:bifunctional non-homologous end joining protein LigD